MTYRILIAEDDSISRRDLREMLEELGHEVTGEARTGAQALQTLAKATPDLLILDVMMPDKTGLDVAREIAGQYPVIIVTAHSSPEFVAAARDCGVMAYLGKPFRQQDLGPTIELAVSAFLQRTDLNAKVARLGEQLEARKLIERAKGLLMAQDQISEADAYRRMQALSMERNIPLKQVAEAVLAAMGRS